MFNKSWCSLWSWRRTQSTAEVIEGILVWFVVRVLVGEVLLPSMHLELLGLLK